MEAALHTGHFSSTQKTISDRLQHVKAKQSIP